MIVCCYVLKLYFIIPSVVSVVNIILCPVGPKELSLDCDSVSQISGSQRVPTRCTIERIQFSAIAHTWRTGLRFVRVFCVSFLFSSFSFPFGAILLPSGVCPRTNDSCAGLFCPVSLGRLTFAPSVGQVEFSLTMTVLN